MTRLARHRFIDPPLIALLAAGLFATVPASTQERGGRRPRIAKVRGHDAEAGDVIVKFRGQPTTDTVTRLARAIDADRHERVGRRGARRMRSKSFDTEAVIGFLQGLAEVEYAEPNYILYANDTVPNDPRLSQLWALRNPTTIGADIRAVKAWDVSTGSPSIAVGVIDTGIDYAHPDLVPNLWSAPAPFSVTIDGVVINCAAGTHGFNAITNTCNPMDDNNHGTHVAGTIGARGHNGAGVVGVSWSSRLVAAKFLAADGSGTTANAVKAIDFLIQLKQRFGAAADIRVLSNSWGGGGYSQTLFDAINAANAANMLFVASAGNDGHNTDTVPHYPSGYSAPNVVSVAATDGIDAKASFSNYGAVTVDLGAPGVAIMSTTRNNTYTAFSGTSMAAPHVAGAAALVVSKCALGPSALKANLLSRVTPIASLSGITVTGGRLDVNAAIRACVVSRASPPTGLKAKAGDRRVTLSWSASAGALVYRVKRGPNGGPYTNVAVGLPSTSYVESGLTNGVTYYYVVSAVNTAGDSGNSAQASAKPVGPPAAPQQLKATALTERRIALSWNAAAGATSYTVKRRTSLNAPYTPIRTVTTTSGVNPGLQAGVTYYYVVTASNAAGTSGQSNQASAKAIN